MKAPRFWGHGQHSLRAGLLSPISQIYNAATSRRANKPARFHAPIPVLCVGNLIMGGAGKTPTAISLAQFLIQEGKNPVFLSRGYGGQLSGPVMVADHTSQDVGDEPLILKKTAPVCIAHDRVAGAKLCVEHGFDIIVMDDGFQNPHLHKDLSILVIDGGYGHGNEKVFPAGPLRESLRNGLARAQATVIIGEDKTNSASRIQEITPDLPVLFADVQPDDNSDFHDKNIISFAGIARPEKVYDTLSGLGAKIVDTRNFADHHPYSDQDLQQLIDLAKKKNAQLVTTEKDLVRIPKKYHPDINVIKITLEWNSPDVLKAVLSPFVDVKILSE